MCHVRAVLSRFRERLFAPRGPRDFPALAERVSGRGPGPSPGAGSAEARPVGGRSGGASAWTAGGKLQQSLVSVKCDGRDA